MRKWSVAAQPAPGSDVVPGAPRSGSPSPARGGWSPPLFSGRPASCTLAPLGPTRLKRTALGRRSAERMSIIIEQVIEPTEDGVRALVNHAGERLTALVAAAPFRATDVVGQSLTVELGFEKVLRWHVVREGANLKHGLFPDITENGAIRVVGTVHNILALEDGSSLYDVYIQAGPEFLTFESGELPGQPPSLHVWVEATLRGLCFYSTWT
jgi:hypothetical protein